MRILCDYVAVFFDQVLCKQKNEAWTLKYKVVMDFFFTIGKKY